MYTWYREKYCSYELVIYSDVCEKEFCKNMKFGSVALAFLYGICFNASLSCYSLLISFIVKKLILKMVRDLSFQPFLNPKFSSSVMVGEIF